VKSFTLYNIILQHPTAHHLESNVTDRNVSRETRLSIKLIKRYSL
jgi:hypothetical protein